MVVKVSFAAATEWNKLPTKVKEVQNTQAFKKKVKQKLLDEIFR